jgi:hypothetical protein
MQPAPAWPLITYNIVQQGNLSDARERYYYVFQGNAGDVISLRLTAQDNNLDTTLALSNSQGQIIGYNDDDPLDQSLVSNSALRSVILPADDYYTITASRYSDADAGNFQLELTLDDTLAGENFPIQASLDPVNSVSLLNDGSTLSVYLLVGDWVEDGVEGDIDTLITLHLPPLPEGSTVENATLDLSRCRAISESLFSSSYDPFGDFGDLTLSLNGYFRTTLEVTQTLNATGETLTTLRACDTVDVTEVVREAYEANVPIVQFALVFENDVILENGEIDALAFAQPALNITFE